MSYILITKEGLKLGWHLNKPKPIFPNVEDIEKIISVLQADGDELEFIIARFKNIPYCFGICTWRGDMAQFIYDNL